MSNNFISFAITDVALYKQKMLNWANRFNIFCLLDNHHYISNHHQYECILAVGAHQQLQLSAGNAFEALKKFQLQNKGWLFGHFAYDLKNELHALTSSHKDYVGFDEIFFFVPQTIIIIKSNEVLISSHSANESKIFEAVFAEQVDGNVYSDEVIFKSRFTKQEYIDTINALKQQILRGNCYEINFCQEFFAQNAIINPIEVYNALSNISPNPFGACYKVNDHWLLCASPERYIKKDGSRLISQPIKGTWKRDLINAQQDEQNKLQLRNNAKEQSENVMVVDLVRNDLSVICREGTVKVDELFGVYTFPQVHQMISTISGELAEDKDWVDAVTATFPMGSMTGAPKLKVMQLIEQYERTKRGIFSGAVGYVTPDGDMDFNVVIRSLMYNQSSQYLSYQVGSGITFYSNAENEYEECLLKAAAIENIFNTLL